MNMSKDFLKVILTYPGYMGLSSAYCNVYFSTLESAWDFSDSDEVNSGAYFSEPLINDCKTCWCVSFSYDCSSIVSRACVQEAIRMLDSSFSLEEVREYEHSTN